MGTVVACFFRSRQGLSSSALASRRLRFERARAGADVGSGSVVSTSRSSDSSEGVARFVPAARDGGGDGEDEDDLCILRCSGDGEDGGELRGDDVGWLRWGLGESCCCCCCCCCSITRSRSWHGSESAVIIMEGEGWRDEWWEGGTASSDSDDASVVSGV